MHISYVLNLQKNQSTACKHDTQARPHALLVILLSLNIVFLSICTSATYFSQENLQHASIFKICSQTCTHLLVHKQSEMQLQTNLVKTTHFKLPALIHI